nr:hypothetical protein [Tanacetum cinerariifolium]
MPTLAEHKIVAGADNRPHMLEKSMYDSWKSRMLLYIQGLPPDVYSLVNHHKLAKEIWDRVRLLMKGTKLSQQERDDLVACLNKAMAFMSTVFSSCFPSTINQLRTSSNPRNQATIQDDRVIVLQVKQGLLRVTIYGEGHMARQCTQPKRPSNSTWFKEKMLLVEAQKSGHVLDEEQLAFLQHLGIAKGQAKAVLMVNLSSYDSDFLSEVLKKQTKAKEDKYIEKDIDLEKENKELENIVLKVGQSAQTMHMLAKPQVFYDNTHKQAIGYQNPFYLKKAQRIKPTLYDGMVISKKHDLVSMDDSEETLIFSRRDSIKNA